MSRAQQESTSGPSRPQPPQVGLIYVFVVTTLTAFLLLVVIWRTPIFGYVASVEVEASNEGELNQGFHRLAKAVVDQEFVTAAVPNSESVEPAKIVKSLKVEPSEVGDKITISYLDKDSQTALDVVNAIGRHAVEQLNQLAAPVPAPKPVERDTNEIDSTRDAVRSDSRLRDQHVDRVFSILTQAINTANEPARERSSFFSPLVSIEEPKPQTKETEPTNEPSSEWTALDNQVKQLQLKYNELLTKLTPEHPDAQRLKTQIDRLASTRDKVGDSNRQNSSNIDPAGFADSAPLLVINTKAMAASLEKYERLKNKVAKSQDAYDNQVNSMADAPADPAPPAIASSAVIAMPEPARIVARIGGRPSPQRTLLIGILSCTFGLVVSWLSRQKEHSNVLTNVCQVELELGLPVAGMIGDEPTGAVQTGTVLRRTLSIATLRSCEVTLALVVVVLLFFSFADSPFANDLMTDPFGTISETVDNNSPNSLANH